MKNRVVLVLPLFLTAAVWAQQAPPPPPAQTPPPQQTPGPPQPGGPGQAGGRRSGVPLRVFARPPLDGLEGGPRGRWWTNPQIAKEIGLSADQEKKMDDIFQQHRLTLIDLNASLEKQEVILDPLVSADQPEESKILAQIDRVAQARAELEKANARMLLGIRRVMTADQWQKLKTLAPEAQTGPRRQPAGGRGETPPPGGPGR